MIVLEQTRMYMESLGLNYAAGVLDSRLEAAAKKEMPYVEFLNNLLAEEVLVRKERYTRTITKLAKLPFRKTIDEFDFDFQQTVDKRQIRELAAMSFVSEAANVIFLGPPGVGKTHLAVGLGMEAIVKGYSVYFVNANNLVEDLRKGYADNRLNRRMKVYLKPRVLIVDEIGYLPMDSLAATLFFQMVSARYERGSIILTSNKSFGEWGEIFGDPVLASEKQERLMHHSYVVNIRGDSYRLKEKKKAGLIGFPKEVGQFLTGQD
jgi:DNA replication protein DnaC